jgi:Ca2+-binding RTX toxin-like protein
MANNLTVTATHDYRAESIGVVDNVIFNTLEFAPLARFLDTQLSTSLGVTPDSNNDAIAVFMTSTSFSAAAWTTPLFNFHLEINGTSGADTITGSPSQNQIYGGSGADTLVGSDGGNDFTYHHGSEIMPGETVSGGAGFDEILVFPDSRSESFNFSGIALSSIEALRITNAFFSGVTTVRLNGSQIGTGAIDHVFVQLDVGGIALKVSDVLVNLSGVTFDSWHNAIDSITIIGTAGPNILYGSSERDKVIGKAGADILDGGPGKDVLTGGKGNDAFVFDTALGPTNVDRIADFTHLHDKINLDQSVFTALSAGNLPHSAFHVGRHAADSNDHIIYDQAHGKLYYDPDGAGGAHKVLFATLSHSPELTTADFFIF